MTEEHILLGWLLAAVAAALSTYVLIKLVIPWLRRNVLAQVTGRSSHAIETPEGAGIVVVPVILATMAVAMKIGPIPQHYDVFYFVVVGLSALILTMVGFVDDARGLPVLFRLVLQFVLVGAVVVLLPSTARVLPPYIPFIVERLLIIVGGVWFVNLFNFMDGIDLISVVETSCIAIGILILAWLDVIPHFYGWMAAALLGAAAGFAPWNAPPARLFLGDSGSIPIGFLFGVILLHAAAFAGNAFAPAVIIPLYYLADATITLLRRCWRGERFWRSHREHYYQQTLRNGFTVGEVLWRVAGLNVLLIILGVGSTYVGKLGATILFVVASIAVGLTLWSFSHARQACGASDQNATL